jgi:Holliday junction resolvasome RuvABC endonuclease subunit
MNVLALDLGTKMWVAIWKYEEILSGVKRLHHDKESSGSRFLDFRNWLIEVIQAHNIYMVYFERVYGHKGTDAAHVYGGFMYMLAAVCEEFNVKCVGIPVSTIKKIATGNGRASKEDVIAFVKSKGFDPADDNEADAIAILFAGLHLIENKGKSGSFLDNEAIGAPSPVI